MFSFLGFHIVVQHFSPHKGRFLENCLLLESLINFNKNFISNKNYLKIVSGSGFMAKRVRQPPHFSTNFWVGNPCKFSSPWLPSCGQIILIPSSNFMLCFAYSRKATSCCVLTHLTISFPIYTKLGLQCSVYILLLYSRSPDHLPVQISKYDT